MKIVLEIQTNYNDGVIVPRVKHNLLSTKSVFGSAFAAAFLFNRDHISFGYKTKHNFHAWTPPLNAPKTSSVEVISTCLL